MAGRQSGQRGINVDSMIAQDLLKRLNAAAEEVNVGLGSGLAAVFPSCVLACVATAEASGTCRTSTVALRGSKRLYQRMMPQKQGWPTLVQCLGIAGGMG